MINRRKTRKIMVGGVAVGGDAPITVQSMTNTPTADIKATIAQIRRQEAVGCDITRCSCPDEESALALKEITRSVKIPVVADIHFDYRLGILAAENGAACLRINPGNIGGSERVREVVKAAKANNCSIRIGVNGGSLDKNCWKNMANLVPTLWSKALWNRQRCWKTTISGNSKSASSLPIRQ